MKKLVFDTTLRFRIGEGTESELKVNVEYILMPSTQHKDDAPEVEIKRIKFRYEDTNGRLYWIDLPDWMMEYIVANEPFRNELRENGAE